MDLKADSLTKDSQPSNNTADMLKAIGHPVRWRIIRELAKRPRGCCGDMCDCFTLSQSTVSQHLSVLKSAGLIDVEQIGTKSSFSIRFDALKDLQVEISELLETARCNCDDG
ncbi:MAG: metalloregulator ArsR/SmtB family transcription factor [Pseudomonadota bacterium]